MAKRCSCSSPTAVASASNSASEALPRLEKEARTHKDRRDALGVAEAAKAVLDGGRTLFSARGEVDTGELGELNLLTTKPFLYVFNADEKVLTDPGRQAELRELVAPADAVFLDAKVESLSLIHISEPTRPY